MTTYLFLHVIAVSVTLAIFWKFMMFFRSTNFQTNVAKMFARELYNLDLQATDHLSKYKKNFPLESLPIRLLTEKTKKMTRHVPIIGKKNGFFS